MGVELATIRSTVDFIIKHGEYNVQGEIDLTPRAKKVISLALDEARHLKYEYVGTQHILLGLVQEGEGIAAGVLYSMGVRLEIVRRVTDGFIKHIEKEC